MKLNIKGIRYCIFSCHRKITVDIARLSNTYCWIYILHKCTTKITQDTHASLSCSPARDPARQRETPGGGRGGPVDGPALRGVGQPPAHAGLDARQHTHHPGAPSLPGRLAITRALVISMAV